MLASYALYNRAPTRLHLTQRPCIDPPGLLHRQISPCPGATPQWLPVHSVPPNAAMCPPTARQRYITRVSAKTVPSLRLLHANRQENQTAVPTTLCQHSRKRIKCLWQEPPAADVQWVVRPMLPQVNEPVWRLTRHCWPPMHFTIGHHQGCI